MSEQDQKYWWEDVKYIFSNGAKLEYGGHTYNLYLYIDSKENIRVVPVDDYGNFVERYDCNPMTLNDLPYSGQNYSVIISSDPLTIIEGGFHPRLMRDAMLVVIRSNLNGYNTRELDPMFLFEDVNEPSSPNANSIVLSDEIALEQVSKIINIL